jgi:ABC-type phosphate transport system substrate-binding protein
MGVRGTRTNSYWKNRFGYILLASLSAVLVGILLAACGSAPGAESGAGGVQKVQSAPGNSNTSTSASSQPSAETTKTEAESKIVPVPLNELKGDIDIDGSSTVFPITEAVGGVRPIDQR